MEPDPEPRSHSEEAHERPQRDATGQVATVEPIEHSDDTEQAADPTLQTTSHAPSDDASPSTNHDAETPELPTQPSQEYAHSEAPQIPTSHETGTLAADGTLAEYAEAPDATETPKPRLSAGMSILPQIQVSEADDDADAQQPQLQPSQIEGEQAQGQEQEPYVSSEPAAQDTAEATDAGVGEDAQGAAAPAAAGEQQSETQPVQEAPAPIPAPPAAPKLHRSNSASLGGSSVFIISALNNLLASKDAKGSKPGPKEFRAACEGARDLVKTASQDPDSFFDPKAVFEPFRLACDPSRTTTTQTAALDCIGKMVSYGFFSGHPSASGAQTLPDLVIATICQLPPASPSPVTLQQLKALLAIVLAGLARQSALLQAVRTAYDVFLLSKDPQTQAVAQGVLTQMCSATFGKIKVRTDKADEYEPGSTDATQAADAVLADGRPAEDRQQQQQQRQPQEGDGADAAGERVTLKEMESRASFDQSAPGINLESTARGASTTNLVRPNGKLTTEAGRQASKDLTEEEILVKDAFLVLRALCKLSMKPLGPESERDLRSHGMRSKLLSLHLILGILKGNLHIFEDTTISLSSSTTGERTPLVQAVKQYLCLSLSRNAVSPVNQVFEVACEIFWIVLSGLRTKLKKEIEVLLNEIFLPILEMRTSTTAQKSILLSILMRVCRDPQALVEIYLNYDCDRTALDNVYERLITVTSKISQAHVSQEAKDKAKEAQISAEADQQSGASSGGANRVNRQSTSSTASTAISLPPALSTAALPDSSHNDLSLGLGASEALSNEPVEVRLKRQSLECLCAVLRSLVVWSQRASTSQEPGGSTQGNGALMASSTSNGSISLDTYQPHSPRVSEETRFGDEGGLENSMQGPYTNGSSEPSRTATPDPVGKLSAAAVSAEDDPTRFQDAKQRKTILLDGIRKFNFKPKRGIDFLLQHGFLRSRQPSDIARFLLYADGLNKAQIGEYLGEGEPENIAIMHAFVDLMDFENMPFTTALRRFLQAFRLPGESQKIDRYMLKFAERYVAGNPNVFANADTAYVFAYSVIMLNTDAHNPQVKNRMTLKDFLRNNDGIDDGKSLSEEYIKSVYDEIQNDEIKMKDEQLAASAVPAPPASGLAGAIATVGRDLQREAYVLQSEGMASKTEALFRTMVRAQRRIHPQQRAAAEQFFSASHFEHVRPMFEVAWMAFLAGVSGPMQESDEPETIAKCLAAFRDAIHIVCLFGLELERNAFVTTLAKFTFLNNLGEMKSKNVEAIKTLLGIAQSEGNYLKGSWREVLACVSQLERFQLISGGVDERQLPGLGRRGSRSAAQNNRAAAAAAALPDEEVVIAGGSTEVTIAADMVFSGSARLSGEAIIDFVQCLAENSWEEIQSSGMTDHPRLFSLQKLVEISYYNMNRIRLEWSSIWAILGQHFNQVCVHPNPRVSAFALDSLRQLSNRFLELEELPHFKFQKDFLKPFEYTMRNTTSTEAKDMVLSCLQQMILSRIQNMRSGWRTLFGTLGASAKSSERIATNAFELVRGLYTEHFDEVILAGAFADLTVCLTDFAKATHAQKIALRSVDLLSSLVPAMLASSVCPLDPNKDPGPAQAQAPSDDPMVRFWFPSLFAFYDVIMNGDDLEVRRVALDSLFEILKKYGATFRPDFWATVCQEVIFPIFAVLRSRSDVSRFSTQEDMSVWLSTTMIQALRNLINLWTYYFETLETLLPKLLSLLCACICQENDTLARIGTSCLQQLLEDNVRKLSEEQWSEVVGAFLELFRTTTAHQLFDPALRADRVASSPSTEVRSRRSDSQGGINPLSPGLHDGEGSIGNVFAAQAAEQVMTPPLMTASERRRAFKQIIVKCVLQLLLIETTHSLLSKPIVYELIPPAELLRITTVLETSYRFSRRFNADKDLRMALWKVGFMKQLPNLLKQESSSAATLINVLVRLHGDTRPSHRSLRAQVRRVLVPLGEDVVNSYLPLDPDAQARNVAAWTPVVAEVFSGICTFHDVADGEEINADEDEFFAEPPSGRRNGSGSGSTGGKVFTHHARIFYPLAVDLLSREPLPASIGEALRTFFYKVGVAQGMIDESADRERRRLVQEGRDKEKGLRGVSMENLVAGVSTSASASASASRSSSHSDGASVGPSGGGSGDVPSPALHGTGFRSVVAAATADEDGVAPSPSPSPSPNATPVLKEGQLGGEAGADAERAAGGAQGEAETETEADTEEHVSTFAPTPPVVQDE